MNMKQIGHTVLYVGAIGISVFLLFFFVCVAWIGYDVKDQCQSVKRSYEGTCVEALSSLLRDEKRGFRERNDAIWALGQLGDSSATSVLESYYTGVIPAREPLDKSISQYELKKAIALTKGGLNITAFIWRYGNEL